MVGDAPPLMIAPQPRDLDLAEEILRPRWSPVGAEAHGQPIRTRRRDIGRDAVEPQVVYLPRTVAPEVCDVLRSGVSLQTVCVAELVKKPRQIRVGSA